MNIISLQFLGFALAMIAVCYWARSTELRRMVFFIANALFLASVVSQPMQLVPLLAFVALGYAAIWAAGKIKVAGTIATLVLVQVALFAWLKHYPGFNLLPDLPFVFTLVGISYIQFRIIHLVIDVGQGVISRPGVVGYLNYLFHFPALVSGPIQRFDEFDAQFSKPFTPLAWPEVEIAINRIIRGVMMLAVLGALTNTFEIYSAPFFENSLKLGAFKDTFLLFGMKSGIYLYNIFFNFAGSMEILIPLSFLMGITLPENFNKPFRAANFVDLWARWHMTLSNWLKFYLFNSTLRVLGKRFGTRTNMPYLGVAAFFVTFLVIGIWHGATWIFAFYGLLLATGVSVNHLWQIWMPKWMGKQGYRELQQSQWYYQLCRSAALSFLAMSQGAFWLTAPMIAGLCTPAGIAIAIADWLALIVVGTALGYSWDYCAGICSRIWPEPTPSNEASRHAGGLVLALGVGGAASLAFAAAISFGTGYLAMSSHVRAAYIVALIGLFIFAIILCTGYFDRAFSITRDRLAGNPAINLTAAWCSTKIFVGMVLALLLSAAAPDLIYKAF